MEILFELVFQLVVEVFGEILLEAALATFKAAFERENRHPALASAGYLVLGAVTGAASLWFFPQRFIPRSPRPGLSLIIAPLLGGAVMHWWGRVRRARDYETTNLATFYGGAALLFGYSLVRLLWAR